MINNNNKMVKNMRVLEENIITLERHFSKDCSFNQFFAEFLLLVKKKIPLLGDFIVDARFKDKE